MMCIVRGTLAYCQKRVCGSESLQLRMSYARMQVLLLRSKQYPGRNYPMISTTVTKKGQVTIPKEIREALGVKEQDKMVFFLKGKEHY